MGKDGAIRNSNNGGSFSRSVQTKNLKSKGGKVAVGYQKTTNDNKITKKMKHTIEEACRPKIDLNSEAIIHAGPPAISNSQKLLQEKKETRPTIPDVPLNANIMEQEIRDTDMHHHDVVNEIKTRSKVAAFATDFQHIQLL